MVYANQVVDALTLAVIKKQGGNLREEDVIRKLKPMVNKHFRNKEDMESYIRYQIKEVKEKNYLK